ncbi:MAG: prephenate dehydratase domain-containing protein [Spirochaetota bacterium]
MLIVLEPAITPQQRQALENFLREHKCRVHEMIGTRRAMLGAVGPLRPEMLEGRAGVREVLPISKPYMLASREMQKTDSVYRLSWNPKRPKSPKSPKRPESTSEKGSEQGIFVGGKRLCLSVELTGHFPAGSAERLLTRLKSSGVSMLSYRPIRFPGDFAEFWSEDYRPENLRRNHRKQLQFFCELQKQVNMPLLVQVPSLPFLEELGKCNGGDILKIAARQMRDSELLAELAGCGKPLILQRAADASLEEFLMAAEFLLQQGQKELILAETFMPNPALSHSQMLDFANIHLLQQLSHLPVFVSLLSPRNWGHESERESRLYSQALAAVAAGAQGVEFSIEPNESANRGQEGEAISLQNYGLQTEESFYLLEQLEQMAVLLQSEIVRLPTEPPGLALASGTDAAKTLKVAFQGEPGAYSEQALRQFFRSQAAAAILPPDFREVLAQPLEKTLGKTLGKPPDHWGSLERVPCPHFRDMFEAVQKSEVAFAVVPLENSLAGSIAENYDLLLEYPDLCICGETRLRVSHMLIAAKGSRLAQIRTVRSHPQALAQSSRFLEQHGIQAVANFDTAASVRELKEQPQPHVAAIAGTLAAEIHDMQILESAIENNPHNYTRFAIVTRSDSKLLQTQVQNYERGGGKFGNKWSFSLRLRHFSGSLAAALEIFHQYRLDMTKLESRPIMGQPWSYRFYIDALIGSNMADGQAEMEFFRELERISEECRVIGRYWENLK